MLGRLEIVLIFVFCVDNFFVFCIIFNGDVFGEKEFGLVLFCRDLGEGILCWIDLYFLIFILNFLEDVEFWELLKLKLLLFSLL